CTDRTVRTWLFALWDQPWPNWVSNTLADPVVDLRDSNGNLLMTNDNWQDSQESEIQTSGRAPPDDSESAIARTLAAGKYTAILRTKNNATGNGLLEAYELN